MIIQYAPANSLACLFSYAKKCEELPEPFRMQRSVSFRVLYDNYADFVLSLPEDTMVELATSIPDIQRAIAQGGFLSYSFFLKDMAFAIMKELHFAERYKRLSTIILPAAFGVESTPISAFAAKYNLTTGAEGSLLRAVREKGFVVKTPVTSGNRILYNTAVVLYFISQNTVRTQIDLNYDIE